MFKVVECKWPEELQQTLFKDVGWHCTRSGNYKEAIKLFQKSLNLSNENDDVLYKRSETYYKDVDIEEALSDAKAGLKLNKIHYKMNKLENDCIFDQNEFEKNYASVANKVARFDGFRKKHFEKDLRMNKANYNNTLGKPAGDCLYEQQSVFSKLPKKKDPNEIHTPRWRELKAKGLCDVLSIQDIKIMKLLGHHFIKADRRYKAFTQRYLGKSWIDIYLMKQLCDEKDIYCDPIKHDELKTEINQLYGKAWRCTKMLHAREPIYTKRNFMFRHDKEQMKSYKERHLFREQYKTRRDVFNQLEEIRKLAKSGNKSKFMKYTEGVLGLYFQQKTHRVLPRKVEFINEICGIVSLFYVNRLKPMFIDVDALETKEEVQAIFVELLDVPPDAKHEYVVTIFGDKSTYRNPGRIDYVYLNYKNTVDALDRRIYDSKYAIERCYLYHEVARNHLDNHKIDEARVFARKLLEESTDPECDSPIWQYLSYLSFVKCDHINSNCDKIREHLEEMFIIADRLNSDYIKRVTFLAFELNEKLHSLNIISPEDSKSDQLGV